MHFRNLAFACFCACAMQLFSLPADLSADAGSTFNTSTEGWLVVSYPFRSHVPNPWTTSLSFDAGFGNPPGSVRVGDVYGETGIAAPAQYLGNKAGSYGGALVYDIYLRYTDGVTYPALVLNGGSMSLYYDAPSPPLNAWATVTVPLTEAGWRVSGAGDLATYAEFMSVLSNLSGLYVYTEWHTGADDTNVDNVSMTTIPSGVPYAPRAAALRIRVAPNPFSNSTRLLLTAPPGRTVLVQVFDVSGRLVTELAAFAGSDGERKLTWDGTRADGQLAPSGVYFYKAMEGSDHISGRLVLIR